MDLLRSLPIGSYLENPVTWLHKIDPRVKLVWLMTFLIAPLLSNAFWRIGLAASLILLTIIAGIPVRVWRKQMGWLLLLCSLSCNNFQFPGYSACFSLERGEIECKRGSIWGQHV